MYNAIKIIFNFSEVFNIRPCKKAIEILLLTLIAIAIFLILVKKLRSSNSASFDFNLLFALAYIGFLYITQIFYIIKKEKYKSVLKKINLNIKNLENANRELRAFKHDLLNHLQIVSSLIQMKKYENAKSYITSLQNAKTDFKKSGTCNIAIQALFDIKRKAAQSAGIHFTTDILISLEKLKDVSEYTLVCILGNIIDNAIYAELTSANKKKYIYILFKEDSQSYFFSVLNRNSYIDKRLQNKIFNAGFTTKNNAGQGLGLYTVFKLIKEMQWDIRIKSAPKNGTEFIIAIPKSANNFSAKQISQ